MKEDEQNFTEMYKTFTKRQLKKELKQLKNERNPSVSRIRFLSRMLRAKAASSPTNKFYSTNHNLELKNKFWSYVKHYLEKATKVLPTFDKTTCYEIFRSLLNVSTRLKRFKFHLGYHLFHHLGKSLIVVHQPTLKLAK